MYRTNCPSVKNYKRKVALENLEKHRQKYLKGDSDFKIKQLERVEKEIATLKSRIIN